MKPNGFVAAASITSHTSMPIRSQSCASSLTSAMFTDAEDVLQQLRQLGGLGRGDAVDRVDRAAVEGGRRVCPRLGDAADDLGDVLRRPVPTSRVDALGRERQVEVDSPLPGRSAPGRVATPRVVPGYVVDSRTTSCPGRSRVAISAAAPRRIREVGLALPREWGWERDDGSRRASRGRRSPSSRPRPSSTSVLRTSSGDVLDVAVAAVQPRRAWRRRRPARRSSRPAKI